MEPPSAMGMEDEEFSIHYVEKFISFAHQDLTMATKPGILTNWPWAPLGSFKHVILVPWAIESTYSYIIKDKEERDLANFLIFPFMLWRMLQNQLWISFSRYRTAKGNNRIIDKPIEFDQIDRERNWDDQIIFTALLFFVLHKVLPGIYPFPIWRTDGVIFTALIHAGPVEFIYYWLHRSLHHHYLYNRYHSHHHSSIVTEPITSVIHPFAEHIAYFALFAIPLVTIWLNGTASIAAFAGYLTYIDLMNNMGHCNFEFIPKWVFSIFPPLKYLMYTPSFHSLHHTQFRTNYSLFMPIYDYIYGTMDKSSDALYEKSLQRQEDSPDVVHLTHITTPESIYHLRVGFASLASNPYKSKWYLLLMWPVTLWSRMITWIHGRTFVVERNCFDQLRLQTWAIPKYQRQYRIQWQKETINNLIEEAVVEAEEKGVKVLSLGLLNQGEELNKYGSLYIQRHPQLRLNLVDGCSLAVAILLNSLPKGTSRVLLKGNLTKVAYAVFSAMCRKGIKVAVASKEEHEKLSRSFATKFHSNLVFSRSYSDHKVWLVCDGLSDKYQLMAPEGTLFMPFSQFPLKKLRKDCFYHSTPAMLAPKKLENVDSCENWLPRRVMSAWRVAGIVHALEGWEEHECGYTMTGVEKVWKASLKHGFQPLMSITQEKV